MNNSFTFILLSRFISDIFSESNMLKGDCVMFDPTIYDNLKVVLEGHIYDLDLSNNISVINRHDFIDLASMSRTFSIQFQLKDFNVPHLFGEISLDFSLKDFTTEMVMGNVDEAGCTIQINLYTKVNNINKECKDIRAFLKKLWNNQVIINQEISYKYESEQDTFNKINLNFQRKINENQMDDLSSIINYCLKSLEYLADRVEYK
jgi:hypothetical protein